MNNKRKRGMSVSVVLVIMTCLISLVTTCFVLAIRSSILTSNSLKYIESYNKASSAIDNSVDFIVDETNKKLRTGLVSGEDIRNLCSTVEGLFGVVTETSVNEGDDVDMQAGFIVAISSEYTKVNSKTDALVSVVNFSASTSAGKSVITPELSLNKESAKTLDTIMKEKYNSTNLLWNYWFDQMDASDDESYNTLVKPTSKGSSLSSYIQNEIRQIRGEVSNMDNLNIKDGKFMYQTKTWLGSLLTGGKEVNIFGMSISTSSFVDKIVNSALNNSDGSYYGGSDGVNNWVSTNEWEMKNDRDIVHNSRFNKGTDDKGRDIVVLDRNVRMNNNQQWLGTKGATLVIKNNSVVFLNGSFKTDANIYIERGSSLIVKGNLEIEEYTYNGTSYAPIFDADYETNKTMAEEAKNGAYIGGGVICQGNYYYEADSSKGNILLNDVRYDYNFNVGKKQDAYVNGGFTVSGNVHFMFNGETDSVTKLPIGATVYNDGEAKIYNLAFRCDDNYIRPFLLFCNGELYYKFNASQIEGKLVGFVSSKTFEDVADKKCGFAIITCEKTKDMKGSKYIVFANMFYNNERESKNDGNALLDINNAMSNDSDTKYQVRNGFVNSNVLAACSSDMERDAIHWYIPKKLRGSMVAASISASQAKRA